MAAADECQGPMARRSDRQALLRRLRKIEGQVRGIQRMLEEDRYCVDVLVQIGAVKAAIDQVALNLLQDHTRGCVQDAVLGGRGDEAIEELLGILRKYLRQP